MNTIPAFATGRCACGEVAYRLMSPPLVVHCCHCSWCQRETGSAFAINALIERDRVETDIASIEICHRPSASGEGQTIHGCPRCKTVLWSHYAYAGIGEKVAFIRCGSLNDPGQLPPDVHIFTSTRQSWLDLPAGSRVYEEYYRTKDVWSEASLARRSALFE
jgi:hypothetical protein